ncbi:MAG: DUF1203 domain-containing protein [Candidatus Eremiobacteraeota bacterium]|nr:DUF1203 domain-containing protein [Candidatus Eremiobacteraeota bacterium]
MNDPIVPHFRITGLPSSGFRHLSGLSDDELATYHAKRCVADASPGYPDRIELRDANVGESVILVNHAHLPGAGPYQSAHAVFVLEHATSTFDAVDSVPDVLRPRMLSLRAFDRDDMMVDADLVEGRDVEAMVSRLLAQPNVEYVHAHFAKRG